MKQAKILGSIPSQYSKNCPSIKLKSDLKENLRNNQSKKEILVETDMNIKVQLSKNGQDILDKKLCPSTIDKKKELVANLYQLSKVLDKEKQPFSKMQNVLEVEQKKSRKPSTAGCPSEKLTDKISIHLDLQTKMKKGENSNVTIKILDKTSSRISSRIVGHNDQSNNPNNKSGGSSTLSNKRLTPANTKSKITPGHKKNLSTTFIKGTQKMLPNELPSQLNIFQQFSNNISFNEICGQYSKTPGPRKLDEPSNIHKNFNEMLANKLKAVQGSGPNSRHRRGLSNGQVPIFIDQHVLEEKIKPAEFTPIDPQQEQEEFFEKFFHSDKMTFDFEKLIISQKNKPQGIASSVTPTPSHIKQASHTRNKSTEDPNSILPTGASSRWNTKRTSVGDDPQTNNKENLKVVDHSNN